MAYGFNDDKSKKDIKAAILELAYPVGSIYQSTNNVSPQTFLGGTWQAITGRFLVAQGNNGKSGNAALNLSAGATGGETNHVLTESEVGKHTHGLIGETGEYPIAYQGMTQVAAGSGAWGFSVVATNKKTETNTNNPQAHNNLPPYLAVYTWKRTA